MRAGDRVVLYGCTRCGDVQHINFGEHEALPIALNCSVAGCNAGRGMDVEPMVATRKGMFQLSDEQIAEHVARGCKKCAPVQVPTLASPILAAVN